MAPLDSSLLDLQYRADLNILTARWQREAPLAEVQKAHEALLQLALTNGATRWLMDRRRFTPAADIAEWVAKTWLPSAAQQVAGTLRLASLVSPDLWQLISSQADIRESTKAVLAEQKLFRVKVFTDEGEAVAWLTAAAG